jgi:5,10-methylenetetrahydrofolate reductase
VELEPPELYHPEWPLQSLVNIFLKKIIDLAEFVDWISLTNRHIYNMSSLTACNKALKVLKQANKQQVKVAMHLTTRQNVIDTFKQLQDIQEVGLKYLMPLLGDPRGPKSPGYFENSLDLLRFVSYVSSGKEEYLDQIGKRKHDLFIDSNDIIPQRANFKENFFHMGTVLDPNPVRVIHGRNIPIRESEVKLFPKKISAGATYFMSQAIFSADYYFQFFDEIGNTEIPIGIGLIPTRLGLQERLGVPIPQEHINRLKGLYHDKKAQLKEGNVITHEILDDLLYRGGSKSVNWIHIYSFGSLDNVYEILGEEFVNYSKSLKKNQERTNSIFLRSL